MDTSQEVAVLAIELTHLSVEGITRMMISNFLQTWVSHLRFRSLKCAVIFITHLVCVSSVYMVIFT